MGLVCVCVCVSSMLTVSLGVKVKGVDDPLAGQTTLIM